MKAVLFKENVMHPETRVSDSLWEDGQSVMNIKVIMPKKALLISFLLPTCCAVADSDTAS